MDEYVVKETGENKSQKNINRGLDGVPGKGPGGKQCQGIKRMSNTLIQKTVGDPTHNGKSKGGTTERPTKGEGIYRKKQLWRKDWNAQQMDKEGVRFGKGGSPQKENFFSGTQ